MGYWGYTLEQIRAATKTQIINWVTNKLDNMTKREIIELLLQIYSLYRSPTVIRNGNGQITSMEAVLEDAEGTKIGSLLITWIYYATGEVDEITVLDRDADDEIIGGYVVKHFKDAKPPELTPIEP